MLNLITQVLSTHAYVHLIALDFSQAFYSLSHAPSLRPLTALGISDSAYNWLNDFLSGTTHVTKYGGMTSTPVIINASVIKGSGVGPFCFSAAISTLIGRLLLRTSSLSMRMTATSLSLRAIHAL